jgi:hypothetical protein
LADRRLTAVERLAELELSLGRHEDLIGALAAELTAHPIRERLAGHLMVALHRSGRQADALSVARELRSPLADQHGLDPGSDFVCLEQALLTDDPAVTAAPLARRSYLPYDIPDFTGRTAELERFSAAVPGVFWAIDGMAGLGKTTFAVHAARRVGGSTRKVSYSSTCARIPRARSHWTPRPRWECCCSSSEPNRTAYQPRAWTGPRCGGPGSRTGRRSLWWITSPTPIRSAPCYDYRARLRRS